MEELSDLYEICEWAVYHGYREISTKTLLEIMQKGGTIGRNSLLEKRLSFDGYVYSIKAMTDGRPTKLVDSLKYLDELHQMFSNECASEATNEYRWLRIRQLTVMQIAILKLKDHLQMHLLAPPNRPSDIILPKSFQVEAFREEVEQLFTKYKKYTSSTVLGKLEDQMTEIFVETLTKPFNSNLKTKYALHHVFNMFPIDTFQYEAVTFCKAVELEALPQPGHFYPHRVDVPPVVVGDQVWNEKDREKNGPYASTNSSSVPAPPVPPVLVPPIVSVPQTVSIALSQPSVLPSPISPIQATQTSNGVETSVDIETDEQNDSEEEENLDDTAKSHPDNAALQNLVNEKNKFQETNSKHDPLRDAIGNLNDPPVHSRAGRKTRSMTNQDNHTPIKKSRLTDSRKSASEVSWSESEDEGGSSDNKNGSSKFTIENLKKKKFDPKLSKSKVISSPSVQSVSGRDPGVRLAWTKDEEDALLAGVSIHGAGNWKAILGDANLNYRFRGRTNVNLKDKYRNMVSS